MKVTARPLTAESFAPFGQVLQASGFAPVRIERAASLDNRRGEQAQPNLTIVRYAPKALPLQASLWERHPHSTQSFVPMAVSRYLVLVCPPADDGAPDIARMTAFVAAPGQGVSYDAGTWHHGMAPLDTPGLFANLIWQDGSAGDCEFHQSPLVAEVTTAA
jgi:ureidoglycolate lyase